MQRQAWWSGRPAVMHTQFCFSRAWKSTTRRYTPHRLWVILGINYVLDLRRSQSLLHLSIDRSSYSHCAVTAPSAGYGLYQCKLGTRLYCCHTMLPTTNDKRRPTTRQGLLTSSPLIPPSPFPFFFVCLFLDLPTKWATWASRNIMLVNQGRSACDGWLYRGRGYIQHEKWTGFEQVSSTQGASQGNGHGRECRACNKIHGHCIE